MLLKPLGQGLGAVLKGLGVISTPAKPPVAATLPTRDDAAAAIAGDDELRRRRGAAADIITGAAGAGTPLSGGKLTLGS